MYATTRKFLDYFNLKSLDQLPPLAEIKELDNLSGELGLENPQSEGDASEKTSTEEGGEEGSADAVDDEVSPTAAESEDDDPTEPRAADGEEATASADSEAEVDDKGQKLQKVLANVGWGSRRKMERWIEEGRVTLEGNVARLEIVSGQATVKLDGKPIEWEDAEQVRPALPQARARC